MSDVFGIDLGTTYSVIAFINDNGQAEVIRNAEGETMPSVVFFETADNMVVGQQAKNTAVMEPDLTVSLIKRHMGTDHLRSFHGKEMTPESISALILKHLVMTAREATGRDTNRVVITVPAYFGTLEKDATRSAGELAGLDVVGIVTEPVAAALSYGYTQDVKDTILVYDLGGGTFDTTILTSGGGQVEVLVIDGNRELGGADWDARLVSHLASRFEDALGIGEADESPMEDDDFRQALVETAEKVKQALSQRISTKATLAYMGQRQQIEVTRDEFESLTSDLLEMTLDKVQATIDAAQQKKPGVSIDTVLLVGGSSKMPAVREELTTRFGFEPKLVDPDLSVAKGAAIYGTLDEADAPDPGPDPGRNGAGTDEAMIRPGRVAVHNVLPKGLGVGLVRDSPAGPEDYVKFLVHKNESLPAPADLNAVTYEDGATEIPVRLFEQGGETESDEPGDNHNLAENGVLLTGLPHLPKGSPLQIKLTVDAEGTAVLEAFEPTTGQRLTGKPVRRLTEERMDELKETLSRMTTTET